jgi:hypothetical protein
LVANLSPARVFSVTIDLLSAHERGIRIEEVTP